MSPIQKRWISCRTLPKIVRLPLITSWLKFKLSSSELKSKRCLIKTNFPWRNKIFTVNFINPSLSLSILEKLVFAIFSAMFSFINSAATFITVQDYNFQKDSFIQHFIEKSDRSSYPNVKFLYSEKATKLTKKSSNSFWEMLKSHL